jgi:hypothetical protein
MKLDIKSHRKTLHESIKETLIIVNSLDRFLMVGMDKDI